MRNVLKSLACALALAAGIFLGLTVPASPSHATAVPQPCGPNQTVVRVYYSDPAFQHPVCQDIISPPACEARGCDQTPYFKDVCGSACIS